MIDKITDYFRQEEIFDIDGAIGYLEDEIKKAKIDFISVEESFQDQISKQNDFIDSENGDLAIENIKAITTRLNNFRDSQKNIIKSLELDLDELVKAKTRALPGEIRSWHDGKYQKTTTGWIKIQGKKKDKKKDSSSSDSKPSEQKTKQYAKKTDTERLKKVSSDKNKPEKIRKIAQQEVKRRDEDNKKDEKNVEKNINFLKISDNYFEKALVDYADVILLNENSEVLLLLRSKTGGKYANKWGLPGGHVETGELFMQAALRELREETGINKDYLQPCETYKNEDGSTSHYYQGFCETQEYEILLDYDEHSQYMWCSLYKIDDYPLIHDLANRIKAMMFVTQ